MRVFYGQKIDEWNTSNVDRIKKGNLYIRSI